MSSAPLYQSISRTLAADIVAGKLPAGTRLEEVPLAKRFDVSRSPVRDALRHLAATHLIDYQPRRGFSVAGIEPENLRDLFEGLTEVEVICAGLCAMRATMIERIELEKLFSACVAVAKSEGDPDAYAVANDDFHSAIYAGAHNMTLEGTATKLRQRFSPFRTPAVYMKRRIEASVSEHEKILDALMRQDRTAAMQAMRVHANSTATNVLDRIFGNGDNKELAGTQKVRASR